MDLVENEQLLLGFPHISKIRKLSKLVGDTPREAGVYRALGIANVKNSALLLFCSGKGTRLITDIKHPKPIVPATLSQKTPLELILRATPDDIGKIIISVTPESKKYIKKYLLDEKFFQQDESKIVFVNQPLVKEKSSSEKYPGGTGLVIKELFQNSEYRSILAEFENIISLDGEKLGYETDVLFDFLGYHLYNKRSISVATYPLSLMNSSLKKFACIDVESNTIYSRKKIPERIKNKLSKILESRGNRDSYQLGGGVYILNQKVLRNIFFGAVGVDDSREDILKTFTYDLEEKVETLSDGTLVRREFKELPITSILNSLSNNSSFGYFQINRGSLGVGIKQTQTLIDSTLEKSLASKDILEKLGWTVFPDADVEVYRGIFGRSVRTAIRNGTQFFASAGKNGGEIAVGNYNIFKISSLLSSGEGKITTGDWCTFGEVILGGNVEIGSHSGCRRGHIFGADPWKWLRINSRQDFSFIRTKLTNTSLLKRVLYDDYNFKASDRYKVKLGNKVRFRDCSIIGNVKIGSNVILEDTIIVGSTVQTIIGDGTKIYGGFVYNSKIGKNNYLINSSVMFSEIPQNYLVRDSRLKNVFFTGNRLTNLDNKGAKKKAVIEDSLLLKDFVEGDNTPLYVAEGADISRFVLNGRQLGVWGLTDNHVKLVSYLKKYENERLLLDANTLANSVSEKDSNYNLYEQNKLVERKLADDSAIELESREVIGHYILHGLLGKDISHRMISASVGSYYPGMFLLKQTSGDNYINIITKSFEKHKNYLLSTVKQIPKVSDLDISELREAMDAALGLESRIFTIGRRVVDFFTIQEVKQVLNSIMVKFIKTKYGLNPFSENNRKIDSIIFEMVNYLKETGQINSLEDWLLLSVVTNSIDYSTDATRAVLDRLETSKDLYQLRIKGEIPKYLLTTEVVEFLLRNDIAQDGGIDNSLNITCSYVELKESISDNYEIFAEAGEFLLALTRMTKDSFDFLKKSEAVTLQLENLVAKMMKATTITYFFDNHGEAVADLIFLIEMLKQRKDSPTVILVGRGAPVENDITGDELVTLVARLVPAKYRYNFQILANKSALLGQDLDLLTPEQISVIGDSFVIAKGMGNLITMQNPQFDVNHVLMLKGFMGEKLGDILGIDGEFLIYNNTKGSDDLKVKYQKLMGMDM